MPSFFFFFFFSYGFSNPTLSPWTLNSTRTAPRSSPLALWFKLSTSRTATWRRKWSRSYGGLPTSHLSTSASFIPTLSSLIRWAPEVWNTIAICWIVMLLVDRRLLQLQLVNSLTSIFKSLTSRYYLFIRCFHWHGHFPLVTVRACKAYFHPEYVGRQRHYDVHQFHLHSQHPLFNVGCLLHCIYWNRCIGLHGAVGCQLGLYLYDQSHYVYRILSWLYCSHLLCLHVFWIQRTQGANERISLRTRSPHLPRRYEYNPGSECSHSHRQLYLPCVLQDDVHGNSVWCSTRDVLTSCSSVHIWTWLMFKTEEKYRWHWEDIPTPVLYSTPLPASHDSYEW